MPTSAEKDVLVLTELGEKDITLPSMDLGKDQLQDKDKILTTFPKLYFVNGFKFLRCLPNAGDSEVIFFIQERPILQLAVAGKERIRIGPRCNLCVLDKCGFILFAYGSKLKWNGTCNVLS